MYKKIIAVLEKVRKTLIEFCVLLYLLRVFAHFF